MLYKEGMLIERTYSQARAELASLMDRAVDDRETVIIERRGRPAVALIAADELRSMEETLHLLRSPANAARLLAALARATESSDGIQTTLEGLKRELGVEGDR